MSRQAREDNKLPKASPPSASSPQNQLIPTASALVGMASAVATNLVLYPLDLLKVRLQAAAATQKQRQQQQTVAPSNTTTTTTTATSTSLRTPTTMITPNAGVVARTSWFSSLYQVTRATWAQGGLAGFYVGLTPGLIGPTVAWGSYMLAYTWSKQNNVIAHALNLDARSPGATFIAGVQAGVFMTLVTNPIFVVKTRMQTSYLQQQQRTSPFSSTAMTSLRLRHVVADLIKNEGIRGMYKGLVPALPLTTHGALHWAIFESMKSVVLQHSSVHPPQSSPSSVPTTSETTHIVALSSRQLTYTQTLIVAALSKVVAAAATYPLHVIKTCIQAHRGEAPISVRQVSANIYALNGLRGFYAGFLPHLLRTVPSSTVTMFFIEQLTQAMMAAFPNTVSSLQT